MIAAAIEKILGVSKPEIHSVTDVHGIEATFSTKQLFQVEAGAPNLPKPVTVSTLQGFGDLIEAGLEDIESYGNRGFMVHVEDEGTVSLKASVSDDYGRRHLVIKANPVEFRRFTFGQWMSQEEFVIAVASLFAETPDKAYVLSMASSLTNDATNTSEDDGFTQKATVKAGLRMKEAVTLKPRVALAPFRTFPELQQPVSEFVFRAKCDGDAKPMLMLVEADGGRWKIDAMHKIKDALKTMELPYSIVS